jgi:hypothetical protein
MANGKERNVTYYSLFAIRYSRLTIASMPIDYATLKSWPIPDVEHRYAARDTMLYALGLGCGSDPTDRNELQFVFEDGLKALPTMAVVLGAPGFWMRNEKTGVDWRKILHGEQGLILHRPLPVAGTVIGRTRIKDIVDKGRERGALMFTERGILDKESGAAIATLTSTTVMRGDGGFGGPSGPTPAPHPLPERAPDIPTLPQAALIYRLSGDMNPLHADPKVAAAAGFSRPILHGCAHSASPAAPCSSSPLATTQRGSPHAGALHRARLSRRDHPHANLARRHERVVPRARTRTRRRDPQQRLGEDRPRVSAMQRAPLRRRMRIG